MIKWAIFTNNYGNGWSFQGWFDTRKAAREACAWHKSFCTETRTKIAPVTPDATNYDAMAAGFNV